MNMAGSQPNVLLDDGAYRVIACGIEPVELDGGFLERRCSVTPSTPAGYARVGEFKHNSSGEWSASIAALDAGSYANALVVIAAGTRQVDAIVRLWQARHNAYLGNSCLAPPSDVRTEYMLPHKKAMEEEVWRTVAEVQERRLWESDASRRESIVESARGGQVFEYSRLEPGLRSSSVVQAQTAESRPVMEASSVVAAQAQEARGRKSVIGLTALATAALPAATVTLGGAEIMDAALLGATVLAMFSVAALGVRYALFAD